MGDRQTIADSKRAFHQQFPYVIAPLYRRLADELLVELHLLSHQTNFTPTVLFSVGLRTVFTAFTRGYRPAEHPPLLFAALCNSNGFDADHLSRDADQALTSAADQTPETLSGWIEQYRFADDSHYSRLMIVGILGLIEASQKDGDHSDEKAMKEQAIGLADALNLPASRIEKDINIFTSSRERMQQAVELMEETLESERRKREKRQLESVSGNAS